MPKFETSAWKPACSINSVASQEMMLMLQVFGIWAQQNYSNTCAVNISDGAFA